MSRSGSLGAMPAGVTRRRRRLVSVMNVDLRDRRRKVYEGRTRKDRADSSKIRADACEGDRETIRGTLDCGLPDAPANHAKYGSEGVPPESEKLLRVHVARRRRCLTYVLPSARV